MIGTEAERTALTSAQGVNSIISSGGGGGTSYNFNTSGFDGGSGGGSGNDGIGGAGNEGGYSPVEGYAGGKGSNTSGMLFDFLIASYISWNIPISLSALPIEFCIDSINVSFSLSFNLDDSLTGLLLPKSLFSSLRFSILKYASRTA